MTLTQIKPAGLSTPVDLADNAKIRLGTGNDLEIYHDGSNSVITAGGAGDLQLTSTFDDVIIQAADNIFISPQGGEDGLKVYGNDAVYLYFDNDRKLRTVSEGVIVEGKLGIGAATIDRLFHVEGTNNVMGKFENNQSICLIEFQDTDTTAGNRPSFGSDGNSGVIYTGGSERIHLNSVGHVGIGTSPNYELQVNDPSGVVSAIQLTNTTTGTGAGDGFLIYNHGNNALISNEEIGSLKFQTSGIERLVIESDGRLICGAVATADTGTYYDDITINNSNTASGAAGGAGLSIVSGDSSYGGIIFSRSGSHGRGYIKYGQAADQLVFGTQTIDRLMIEDAGNNGDVHVKTGNLVIDTSGKGIDFSAVSDGSRSVSSNLFDDYEEGSWTPTIAGSSTEGSATVTTQYGKYVKAGKLVTVSVYVGWNSFTGSGNLNIKGLPFTCWNDAHAGAVMTKDLTFPSGAEHLTTHTWANVSYFRLYSSASNATWSGVTCDSTGFIIATMTYFAA